MVSRMGTDEAVFCCFCGELLSDSRAATLTVAPAGAREETQVLFCHGTCFVPLLDGRIPYNSALRDEVVESLMTPMPFGKPN